MRKFYLTLNLILIFLAGIHLQACSSVQQMIQGTPTYTPTNTQTPSPTYTPTSTITSTLTKTPTPNATATEFSNRGDLMHQEIQKYVELGYLSESTGSYNELPNFKTSLARVAKYKWQTTSFSGSNYVVSAHFSWNTASYSNYSGCGLSVGPKSFITPRCWF